MQTRTGFVMDSQRDHIQPGPIDDSVLTLQSQHRSQAVWFDIDQVYYKLNEELFNKLELIWLNIMLINFILQASTSTIECRRGTSTRDTDVEQMHSRVIELL